MPDSTLELIIDVNDPQQSGLQSSFLEISQAVIPDFVRGDKTLAVTIRPVVAAETATQEGGRPFNDDHASGDTYALGIGRADTAATGGTFRITYNGVSQTAFLNYNATTTQLDAALTGLNSIFADTVVTMPGTGVYLVTTTDPSAGTLAAITIETGDNRITPPSDILISIINDGSGGEAFQFTIVLKQQLVALSFPATALTAAGVTKTYDQAQTATQNRIARIAFNADGTYGGLYSISATVLGVTAACGQAGPLYTAAQLGAVLANHPSIVYQGIQAGTFTNNANNIAVTQDGEDFVIEFLGTASGVTASRTISGATVANPTVLTFSADHNFQNGDTITITNSSGITPSLNGTHTFTRTGATTGTIPVNVTVSSSPSATATDDSNQLITVANVSLLAPTGVSGTLDLNTLNLAQAFAETTETTLTMKLSVERTRASGEVRTLLLVDVVLKRDILDFTSLIPISYPQGIAFGNIIYLAPNGIDSNDGGFAAPKLTLAGAIAAASSGDLIFMAPGDYDQGDATNTLPDGVHLQGSGIGVTTIISDRLLASGPIFQPGNGSTVRDLTIEGNAAAGEYQAPFGTTSGSSWATAYCERIELIGDSDGFYLVSGTRTLYAKDCIIRTKYDGLNCAGGTAHVLEFINCQFYTIGPTLVSPSVTIARCMAISLASSVKMIGGKLIARNGGATYSVCFTIGSAATAYFQGVEFDVSNGSDPTRYALTQAGTVEIRGGRFLQTNTSGIIFSSISGGTVMSIFDCYISTTGNASGSPITLNHASSTLKVRGCTLVSNGSRVSIDNAGASSYTVDAFGSFANNTVDTGVTASGLTVDAGVT